MAKVVPTDAPDPNIQAPPANPLAPPAAAASAAASASALTEAQTPVGKGGKVMVLSQSKNWRACTIVDSDAMRVKIHYDGFNPAYDEWLERDSPRIRRIARERELSL